MPTIRDQVTGDIERNERETLVVAKHFADHGVLEGYDFQEGSLVGIITIELNGNHHNRLTINYRSAASLEPSRNT